MHLLVLSVVPVDTYHDETLGSDERHTYMLYLFQDETFFGDITLSGVMSSGSNKTNQTKLTLDVIDMSTQFQPGLDQFFHSPSFHLCTSTSTSTSTSVTTKTSTYSLRQYACHIVRACNPLLHLIDLQVVRHYGMLDS